MPRPNVWVVTPELHRRGGTERAVAEQIERWRARFDIRVYAMSVDAAERSRAGFRTVPRIPGPHLGRYLWWFAANRFIRAADARRSGGPDAIVSPGVNAFDADAIGVHMVFAKYWERVRPQSLGALRDRPASLRLWHRLLFVQLIRFLERRVYEGPALLWSVSSEDGRELERRFGRPAGTVDVAPHGVDVSAFDPHRREAERADARHSFGVTDERVVLLVANDAWKKGVDLAIAALARLPRDVVLALAGDLDDAEVRRLPGAVAADRIRVWPRRRDPFAYYAACDVLVAPSREDSFNLPALEAMACGLPVVVSRHAGASELVEPGTHAFVVDEPEDVDRLAAAIELALEPSVARELGRNARTLAERTTWDANADRTADLVMREISMPRFLVLAADPFGVGGIERVTRTLVGALADRFGGDRVGVVSLWGGRAELPGRILHRGRTPPRGRVPSFEGLRFTLAALRGAHRWRRRLVVVVCHPHLAPVAVAAGRLVGARVAVWCHGDEVWGPLRPRVRLALQRADLVFAPSRFTAEQVTRWARLRRDPVVVPHAVTPGFAPTSRRRSVPGRVIAVARMERRDRSKGIDTLLRAWSRVSQDRPDAELVVVGDGSDRSRLEQSSRSLVSDGRVRFTGRLDDADLRELFRTAAVFALPTRARVGVGAAGEGFGLVFAEAAAAGVPVVAGRSGAVSEVVEDGETGFLVDPMDPAAIADAIGALLDNPDLQREMARNARARAKKRFSYEAFGDRIAELLGSLASVYRPDRE
jgi:glycosyltransferase involved in cell wall biosynthesis